MDLGLNFSNTGVIGGNILPTTCASAAAMLHAAIDRSQ